MGVDDLTASETVSGRVAPAAFAVAEPDTVVSRDIVNRCPGTLFMPGVVSFFGHRVGVGRLVGLVGGLVVGNRGWGQG